MGLSVLGRRSVLLMILNQRRLLLLPFSFIPPLSYRISRVHIHCYLCLLPIIGFPPLIPRGRDAKKRESERDINVIIILSMDGLEAISSLSSIPMLS